MDVLGLFIFVTMQLEIIFVSKVFHNAENGYTVFRFTQKGESLQKTGVGFLPDLSGGEELKVDGEWIQHAKFGSQFKVETFEVIPPSSKEGIIKFLGSGQIKGISLGLASRIVDHLGLNTLDILDQDPRRIFEVRGIGKKNGESFVHSWQEQRHLLKFLQWFQPFGLSQSTGIRWFRQFGTRSQEQLEENPYLMIGEPYRQNFVKIDELALKLGFPFEGYHRFIAAYQYILRSATLEGHTYLPQEQVLLKASQLLKIDPQSDQGDLMFAQLDRAVELEEIARIEEKLSLIWLARAERETADFFTQGRQKIKSPFKFDALEELHLWQKDREIQYSPTQVKAILQSFDHPFFLITGGPGTGKTTVLKGILSLARKAELKVLMAAPTGRAAKRMGEVTQFSASTLHRLLSWQQGDDALRVPESELHCDLLIVDEVSMVDTQLMHALIKSISKTTRLILVGDVDQLPSVGPGQVFRELLEHCADQKVVLDRVFRQADANDIPHNAALINQGKMPEFKNKTHFHFRAIQSVEEALQKTVDLVSKDLPQHFKLDPINDIQVLSPMNKGALGTIELNLRLREALNPRGLAFTAGGREFRLGDKVMQLKNNYEKMVFNGDMGTVLSVDREAKTAKIEFDEVHEYEFLEFDQISLAYATTIHKSQGNEYPVVVMLLDHSHSIMLQRNLFYTGVTRARERVFILSQLSVLQRCVAQADTRNRYTLLGNYLQVKNRFMDFLKS